MSNKSKMYKLVNNLVMEKILGKNLFRKCIARRKNKWIGI